MTDQSAFANPGDFANRAAGDLQNGLNSHNLQSFINDIDSMRHQVPAGQYGSFMQALNTSIDAKNILPSAESVIGVDNTGKNLVVADDANQKALVVSSAGDPLKSMTEQQAATGVDQHMVKVGDLTKGDGKFSILLPPGLDTTGTGKFQVKDLKDNTVTNKDGTVTHNVSGALNDADWAMNIHAYDSSTDASFTGSYTTTSDGNLLNSHIKYDSQNNLTSILGGEVSDIPTVASNPTTPFRELPGNTYSPEVDTTYSPARGAYVTQIDAQPNSDRPTAQVYETTPETGKTQVQQLRDTVVDKPSTNDDSTVTRDQAGNVATVSIPTGTIDGGITTTAIVRDKNERPIAMVEGDGTSWNKISDNQWQETTKGGKQSTFAGQVIVEDSGDIVFKNSAQTIVKPADTGMDRSQTLNNKGQVVFEDLGQGVSSTYTYGADGKPSSEKDVEASDASKTTVTKPAYAPSPIPIEFF